MNPFYNPIFLSKVAKSYLFDINRLHRFSDEDLKGFQDKKFKNIVRFSNKVPLYHDKYKKEGINPFDIKKIEDLENLPLITKEDIKENYPNKIISEGKKKSDYVEVSTSGTTGKSLSIFVDIFDIITGLFGYLRTVNEYDIYWRKSKMTIIGDFASHTAESGYINKALLTKSNTGFIFKKIQWLDTNANPKDNLEKINNFQPDFIGGYVGMLGHMALLKEQGFGKNINPKVIAATGSVLDQNLRTYIESQFGCRLFEVYGATETGLIAFECPNKGYHVLSDYIILEYFRDGKKCTPGQAGNIVVTKLFGKGTPIIRYDAMNDVVKPSQNKCKCDIAGDLIEKIYGREDLSLPLPDGRVMMPISFAEIYSRILYELKSTQLKDTKVVQKDMNNIEIKVVIDKSDKDGVSAQEIINLIQTGFEKKVGPQVKIKITEVNKLGDHEARIVSNVDRSTYEIKEYF